MVERDDYTRERETGSHDIAVALLTEEQERQTILQNRVEATQVARVVCSHVGFPVVATDPVVRQMQDMRAKVVIIEVISEDPKRAIRAVELIRATISDVAIFAIGEVRTTNTIVSAMRAGASEFIAYPLTTAELLEAFTRLSVRRKATNDSGASGGSVPPGGSAPSSGSASTGVPLGVPRSKQLPTLPPKKMARGA